MIADRIVVVSRATRLVHDVQAAAGPGCVILQVDHVGDLEDAVDRVAPYDVLVAGPMADTHAGLARLARVRSEHPESPVVLVLPTPPHSPLPDLVRVGAADLVEVPYTNASLRAAIRRALALASAVAEPEDELNVAPPVPERLGEVLTVASPSGGCGKTFYSTNLAHYLSQHSTERVCLVDLDLQFGEVSTALRLKPRFTIADVMSRSEDEGDLDDFIEEYLVQQRSGLWVLAAPREPAEADRITPPDVSRVIRALRKHFGYLVLDTSAQLSEVVLTAMDQSTRLICMATLDLPSMRNMRIFLETLEKLKIPTERTSVVLNKVEPDLGIKVEEANEILHHKIVATLPYSKDVSRSINEGLPVLASAPKSDIAAKLVASIRAQLEAGEGAVPEAARAETRPAKGARPEKANRPARPPKPAKAPKQPKAVRSEREAQAFQPPQAPPPQWPGRAPFPIAPPAAQKPFPAHASNGSGPRPRRRLLRWIGSSHAEVQS